MSFEVNQKETRLFTHMRVSVEEQMAEAHTEDLTSSGQMQQLLLGSLGKCSPATSFSQ